MSTASTDLWQPAYRGGRLEDLEYAECRRLLVSTTVGRLAFTADGAPRIVPLNYVVFGEHLVVRTGPYSEVAQHALNNPVAFEIDQVDEFLQAGWSVVVSGFADELPPESLRAMDLGETPEPWAEGVRSLYLRLPLTQISGRRVHAA